MSPHNRNPLCRFRWTGVYFGGSVSGASAKASLAVSIAYDPAGYFDTNAVSQISKAASRTEWLNGPVIAGEAGYDFQVSRLVFGGSFDVSLMRLSEQHPPTALTTYCCSLFPPPAPPPLPLPFVPYTLTQSVETNWLMTARGRAGWAVGRSWLLFGTAGLAWMDLKYHAQFTDSLWAAKESADIDKVVNAWVYGAGAEYRVTRHLSAKGEYLVIDFDPNAVASTNLTTPQKGAFPSNVFTHTADFRLTLVRGSITIRF